MAAGSGPSSELPWLMLNGVAGEENVDSHSFNLNGSRSSSELLQSISMEEPVVEAVSLIFKVAGLQVIFDCGTKGCVSCTIVVLVSSVWL